MTKTNFLICSGGACPLRLICRRFHDWIDNEDAQAEEMAPTLRDGNCDKLIEQPFYGG